MQNVPTAIYRVYNNELISSISLWIVVFIMFFLQIFDIKFMFFKNEFQIIFYLNSSPVFANVTEWNFILIFDLSFNQLGNILVSSGNDSSIKVWQRNPVI